MEPLFNDDRFNSNKGIISDCEILSKSSEFFFGFEKNRTLNNHFYHLGLLFDSNHYKKGERWRSEIFTPTRDIYSGKVDYEIILSVQLGKDLNNEYDEKESDKYDPYYWSINKAIEYKRPVWAFYMFLGNLQGLINGNRITEERMIQYLQLFPKEIIQAEKVRLQYIFNFFDERGFLLSLSDVPELIKVGNGIFDELISSNYA